MNIEKHFWKTIFYWIKYLNYNVVQVSKEGNAYWLAHKDKAHVVVFNKDVSSSQEMRFDKSRLEEHQDDIQRFLQFTPKSYTYFYFTDKVFSDENLNSLHPIKFKAHIIRSESEVLQALPNRMMTMLYGRNDKKTTTYYKKQVNNQNVVDTFMIRFTPMTYSLIAINIFVWLFMVLFFNKFSEVRLLDVGGLVHFNVVHGEWYRLITSMFLHVNFEHILMNMLSLFIFGKIVEGVVGKWKMLGIYLIAGLFGNFASLSFNTTTISVGASGAIFGLIGALFTIMFVAHTFTRKRVGQLLIVIVIMMGLSLFMTNINVMAHLGGFLGGAFIVAIGYYYGKQRNAFWILLIALLVIFIALQVRIFTIKEDNIYNKLITDEMMANHYDKAESVAKKTIQSRYADDETYYLNGMITATTRSKAEAIADWERGLKNFPESGVLNYNLAIANRSLGDFKEGLKHIKIALKSEPRNKDYKNLKQELDKEVDDKS